MELKSLQEYQKLLLLNYSTNFLLLSMTSLLVDPNLFFEIKTLLAHTLGLQQVPANWEDDMALIGHLPDLDSMNIVNLITALEEHFDIEFTDEDMSMSTFGNLKTLVGTVHAKLPA